MPDANVVNGIRLKYNALAEDLDDRGWRRWAATEAMALGRSGMVSVAPATGLSDRTVKNGIAEIRDPQPLSSGRQRRIGGGGTNWTTTQNDSWLHSVYQNKLATCLDSPCSSRASGMQSKNITAQITAIRFGSANRHGMSVFRFGIS